MQAFIVGGAVRDDLLGLPVKDRDWVVVGATPQEMRERGFRPVGKDFPVFLHPETSEEYALARTERKTGRGYKGFAFHATPDVTLEEDLLRRDLTINAIAREENGQLIDPYGGREDIERRVFRHVSPAFAEDPVRILRVARFAARFDGFSLAPETLALMRAMVANGEVDHLVPERVWQELARGLMEALPSRMLATLRECDALARILPDVDRLFVADPHHAAAHLLAVLDHGARTDAPLEVRWACLVHDLVPAEALDSEQRETRAAACAQTISERLKAPNECRDLAVLLARERRNLESAETLSAAGTLALLERTDALRRPERFETLLHAARCAALDGAGAEAQSFALLKQALGAISAVNAGAIARQCAERARIPEAIREARVKAVAAARERSPAAAKSRAG